MLKLSTRIATLKDIPALLELHERNISKSEFSMLLSSSLRYLFYKICILENHTFIYILTKNEKLIGVSIVSTDHKLLSKQFKNRALCKFILYILGLFFNGKLKKLVSILAFIFERKVTKIPKDIVANCVEMTILDKEYRTKTDCIIAFFKMYSKNIDYLKRCGNGKIWASASLDNEASIRMIKNVIKPTRILHYRNQPKKAICFLCEA